MPIPHPYARCRYESATGGVEIVDGELRFTHDGGDVVGAVPLTELTGFRRRRWKVGFSVHHGDRELVFDLLAPIIAEKKAANAGRATAAGSPAPLTYFLDHACRRRARDLVHRFADELSTE